MMQTPSPLTEPLLSSASALSRRRALVSVLTVLAAGGLAACGGGGGGESAPAPVLPTLVIETDTAGTATGPVLVSFLFSDSVTAFGATRFQLNGARVVAGSFIEVTPREYTVVVTPFENTSGVIELVVFPTAFKDKTGTAYNTATYRLTQPFDTRLPIPWVTFSDSQPGAFAVGPVVLTMTFNLDVADSFAAGDLFVLGATLSGFTRVSATVYTMTVTPLPGARIQEVTLREGTVTAAVPNGQTNSRSWQWLKIQLS